MDLVLELKSVELDRIVFNVNLCQAPGAFLELLFLGYEPVVDIWLFADEIHLIDEDSKLQDAIAPSRDQDQENQKHKDATTVR